MIVWVLHRRGQQNYVTWGTRQQETNINQMFQISPQFVEERMPKSKIWVTMLGWNTSAVHIKANLVVMFWIHELFKNTSKNTAHVYITPPLTVFTFKNFLWKEFSIQRLKGQSCVGQQLLPNVFQLNKRRVQRDVINISFTFFKSSFEGFDSFLCMTFNMPMTTFSWKIHADK